MHRNKVKNISKRARIWKSMSYSQFTPKELKAEFAYIIFFPK